MDIPRFLLYVLVMAGVTYLIRMLPLAIFRKKSRANLSSPFYFMFPTPF